MPTLNVLSGGAAHALVLRAAPPFLAATSLSVGLTSGAVGAMRDALLAGAPCDLVILTDAIVGELQTAGRVGPGVRLGYVETCVAVPEGEPLPSLADESDLKRALEIAAGIYFPDPERATAGIHFLSVLRRLGLLPALEPRLRPFKDGRTAMAAMSLDSRAGETGLLGCTQETEILATEGVRSAGALPGGYGLKTPYVAAVVLGAPLEKEAGLLAQMLGDGEGAEARRECGFR
ncbi:hypothetical protein DFJ74DRAFT_475576 [Hyaloraphidium curvatum]|nr:hypothetical protein DFJ74DRAFT_475576 [Hyaloraphidium curvatum]